MELLSDDSTLQGESAGKWTMVYDEGFNIIHNNVHYFAFSTYYNSEGKSISDCSTTLVGWYIF